MTHRFYWLWRCLGAVLAITGCQLPALAQSTDSATHCLLLPLAPARRAQQAALIVEAQVLDAQSFWDAGQRRLYTRHRLRVFSLLKGTVADTAGLTVVTEGGRLGLSQQILTNTLHLTAGQQGVLFLAPARWPGVAGGWAAVGSSQGFIRYNLNDGSAAEPFRTYPAVNADFYQQISGLTGQPRQVLQSNPALAQVLHPPLRRPGQTLAVDDVQPRQVPAGAGAVLTLTGSGFGSSRGSGGVEFRNADDGGASRVQVPARDYVSWADTRIVVRVPSVSEGGSPAGSGTVRVRTADGQTAESSAAVTVIYALTNVESVDGNLLQRPNHVAQNASGGLTFRFASNFLANSAAATAWARALSSWRCNTGMNWEVGEPIASAAAADDNQNIVSFDSDASGQLPERVLGRTISYYSGCYGPDGEVVFFVKEIDMQFDAEANFQYGPLAAVAPQIDFESVAVHELGHAQQLNHLIRPGAIMHYAVARGQNTRVLSPASDVAGGRQVLRGRSFRNLGCSGPALLPAPLTGLDVRYAAGTGTVLNWTTRDECFLAGFVAERSLGADTTAWETLGSVAASGQPSYQLRDAQPPAGLRYYRLRLRRPDNSLDNAAPVPVSTDANGPGVVVFPNPAADNDRVAVQYPAAAEGVVAFALYDAVGRRVQQFSVLLQAGLNVLPLDFNALTPGMYILRWRDTAGQAGRQQVVRL